LGNPPRRSCEAVAAQDLLGGFRSERRLPPKQILHLRIAGQIANELGYLRTNRVPAHAKALLRPPVPAPDFKTFASELKKHIDTASQWILDSLSERST
jgi:hypothetical protein